MYSFPYRLSLASFFTAVVLSASAQVPVSPVDFVDPNIGGIGQLLTATSPFVQLPHGMVQAAPVVTPGVTDRYLAGTILGFPAGPVRLMPVDHEMDNSAQAASRYDHMQETATPYYYSVLLEDTGIQAEFTVSAHAIYQRFTFPATAKPLLLLSLDHDAELTIAGTQAVEGSQRIGSSSTWHGDANARQYFYAEFSAPFTARQSGDAPGALLRWPSGHRIEARIGVSYISVAQARANLQHEIPAWSFATVKASARAAWSRALGAIAVTGGSASERRVFYTALYRALSRMTDITEDGRYYSGFDGKVHPTGGHDFYVNDGLWDTYRDMHPLQLLLEPARQQDMIRSYLRMYEQSGWLPSFPQVDGEEPFMIGHHAAALIADTYSKGFRDFDALEAYEAMRKNALEATMLPWRRGPATSLDQVYFDKGFFPALAAGEKESVPEVDSFERRQAVSVTLENSYDNWCVAQMARALGKTGDYELFMRLAASYKNVYRPGIGFMAPRSADGSWVVDFDPKRGGGLGSRDYTTEVDSWLYTFSVQHDPAGLIQLMGGRNRFNARLDQLFQEQYGSGKYEFLAQFPDATGLVGLYAQGNEPSFHIPYLYDFSGQPWKAQQRVRQMMRLWYRDDPLGIPGDDDGGATSSWYVLSAMGFYPVAPGSPVYEIGSPIFSSVTLTLGNGKQFRITAQNVSPRNQYIQSARLNGQPLDRPWFSHSDIARGGTLEFVMGPHPNKQWGASPQSAPPSMSSSLAR